MIIAIGTIIIAIVLIANSNNSDDNSSTNISKEDTPKTKKEISDYDTASIIEGDENNGNISDHVRGKVKNPKVIVVEYADLQCPGCASIMPKMHELYKDYGNQVAFIYRNFPITGHQNARAAAAAAESAGFQGKYWEMIETIYANRAEWMNETGNKRTSTFVNLFKEIAPEGDVEKFRSDMENPNIEKKVNFDYYLGREKDKVTATPAFYVNGSAVEITDDIVTSEDLKNAIEESIKSALKETY